MPLFAQRVMNCGDAGHILLSKHAAEDLGEYRQWQLQLHDLGECEVKHGGRLHVVNLYNEELGNPQVPTKFRQAIQKRRRVLIAVLILFAAAVGGSYYFFSQRLAFRAPDKSIAVLPLENLSHDPDNAYFAEGMQDEILARLSKVADLRSSKARTSSAIAFWSDEMCAYPAASHSVIVRSQESYALRLLWSLNYQHFLCCSH